MKTVQRLHEAFNSLYGRAPTHLIWGPGRVNLIGEHTDYNDGYVLPMAIDAGIRIAVRSRGDHRVRLHSLNMDAGVEFGLGGLRRGQGWGEYAKGVAWALQESGHILNGFDGVLWGDVPVGAGLSSSAAFEIAMARAFARSSGLIWEPTAMARLAQRAESEWVGVQCGIMDQFIAAAGVAGHALLIDCRSRETRLVPLPAETSIVVLDTGTRRVLTDSAYNQRRAECAAAAGLLQRSTLRDVSPAEIAGSGAALPETLLRRARHVVSENARTLAAAGAMSAGDAITAGRLMTESHASLRGDFAVSTRELDLMVGFALAEEGCLGARMTGAGFGGCAVALVRDQAVGSFVPRVLAAYREGARAMPAAYVVKASEGASAAPWPDVREMGGG